MSSESLLAAVNEKIWEYETIKAVSSAQFGIKFSILANDITLISVQRWEVLSNGCNVVRGMNGSACCKDVTVRAGLADGCWSSYIPTSSKAPLIAGHGLQAKSYRSTADSHAWSLDYGHLTWCLVYLHPESLLQGEPGFGSFPAMTRRQLLLHPCSLATLFGVIHMGSRDTVAWMCTVTVLSKPLRDLYPGVGHRFYNQDHGFPTAVGCYTTRKEVQEISDTTILMRNVRLTRRCIEMGAVRTGLMLVYFPEVSSNGANVRMQVYTNAPREPWACAGILFEWQGRMIDESMIIEGDIDPLAARKQFLGGLEDDSRSIVHRSNKPGSAVYEFPYLRCNECICTLFASHTMKNSTDEFQVIWNWLKC
ncbi:hypothetical protein EV421DRAFT_1744926 [Armillaria borealis]|uniref:Uncharacterized protein n=1 Tax=Armillaria borealis TaxID=47425 RepID=A0AA39MD49_9AGAR|nr:hypothetical protein EV421DRAFT_1744926 [Armillaria borealis]